MENILKETRADMLTIGRQLIADPYWLEKVVTGQTEDITSCICCNSCFETRYTDTGYVCPVNAYVCRESDQK